MLNIFICEDNLIHRTKLEAIIQHYILMSDVEMQLVLSTGNPHELLYYLKKHPQKYGIYFLDVRLGSDIDGIQLGAKIRNLCVHGKIIFVTNHSELSPLVFQYKVEAMDYILKDSSEKIAQRIKSVLDQAQMHYTTESQSLPGRIHLTVGTQTRFFELDEIMFIETSANSHKLILHLTNSMVEFYGKISEVEKLSPDFIQVHKSCIANKLSIVTIDRHNRMLTFKNGETCCVSTRKITRLFPPDST